MLVLSKALTCGGDHQSKIVPGLWIHETGPISLMLEVDDFGVKYVGEEHAEHLMSCLQQSYKITHKWKGKNI